LPGPPPDKARVGQTVYRIVLAALFVVLVSLCILYVGESSVKRTSSCLGLQRNASYEHEPLPSHYVLPSGDRIPSVGLGKCAFILDR
jgi:hypothetical protein